MKISGLQKLTLLDYPGKIACTVFTPGCNFRCPFCHNASLVTKIDDDYMNTEQFFDLLKKRTGVLQGVCITGGEPTLQGDLTEFMAEIKDLGYSLKLDTNGYRPDVLEKVIEKGLADYVAMDIKNSLNKYGVTVGIDNFDTAPIEKSVDILKNSNIDYEFRTTVVDELHTIEDIEEIAKWIKGCKRYFLQCFVDSGDLIKEGFSRCDENKMKKLLKVAKEQIPSTELRGL